MRTPCYLRRACAFVVQEDRRCGRERVFGSVFVERRRSERARCCSHGTASVLCQGGPRWRTQPIPVAQLGSMRACLPATVGGRSGCEPTAYRVVEYLMRSRRARHDRALAWNTLLRRKEMPCTAVPREPEVTYAPAAARMVDRQTQATVSTQGCFESRSDVHAGAMGSKPCCRTSGGRMHLRGASLPHGPRAPSRGRPRRRH